jgi:diaminopimelate epimerase
VSAIRGRHFWKMSGSGNDFIFFDTREVAAGDLERPEVVDRLCARATGVGADGVVFLQPSANEAFSIRYLNRDGSLAELCGNASLCSTKLAVNLSIAEPSGFRFDTDAGVISARMAEGEPEIDLQPVRDLRPDSQITTVPGEKRIGFADTGVPHLVVLVDDLERTDVAGRGRELRSHPSLAHGANVNFVGRQNGGGWAMRTYERGVEAETLACGTGSVAIATLLQVWELGETKIELKTRSHRTLTVTLAASHGHVVPSLRGEGRLVFEGELGDI